MTSTSEEDGIHYRLSFASGESLELPLALHAEGVVRSTADWTRLGFQQCPHCPLKAEAVEHCPFATALAPPVQLLARHASFEEVDVQVLWRGRDLRTRTSLQRVLGSILGVLGATSGCPHTQLLKAMAWFHLPFSSGEETLYRALGTYLTGQYLRARRGLSADWELQGLRELYRNLRRVNLGMANRLRSAASEDSSVNGLILLDLLAAETLDSLDQADELLQQFFLEHLQPDA